MNATEFELRNVQYRIGRLTTFQQLHVSRKISPLLPPLVPTVMALESSKLTEQQVASLLEPVAGRLAEMSDEHAEYVVATAMSVVRRKTGEHWAPVWLSGQLMFDDLQLPQVIQIVYNVIQDQLGPFINGFLQTSGDDQEGPEASNG